MKITYIKYALVNFLISMTSYCIAQNEAFPYQTILTDDENIALRVVETQVKVDLIQSTPTGTLVYSETHNATTGLNGELYLEIGNGTAIGSAFEDIDWSMPHYIELSYRPEGFSSFVPMGRIKLLSVPYALFALKVTCENGCPGEDGSKGIDCFDSNGNGVAEFFEDLNGDGEVNNLDCAGPIGPTGPMGPVGWPGIETQGLAGAKGKRGVEILSLTDTVPIIPNTGDFYLDNGTNRADGKPGFRYWDGTTWINL